jgi:hypothetical protein
VVEKIIDVKIKGEKSLDRLRAADGWEMQAKSVLIKSLQQVVLNLILNAVEATGSVEEGPRE